MKSAKHNIAASDRNGQKNYIEIFYRYFECCNCYKLVQGFKVTCLFTGQNNTKGCDTITDVMFIH